MKKKILIVLIVIISLNLTTTIYSTPLLRNGWPLRMEETWGFGIKNQLALYDHDEYGWIISASTNGQISLFDIDGNVFPGWPLSFRYEDITTTGIIIQGPRLGDMNGDGNPELAFRSRVDMVLVYRNEVYSFTGERIESLCTRDTIPSNDDLVRSCPVFVDIDEDGNDELVRIYGNAIHADRFDGTEYPGFPIPIGDYCNLYNLGVVVGAGDGWDHDYNIVIWSTQNHVHAQRIGDLEELPGWPIEVDNPRAFSGPSLIATEEGWIYVIHCQNVLYAWDQDGEALDGFPIRNIGSSTDPYPITNYLQIADIDGDAQPEIVYRDYLESLHAFSLEGEECSGFPRVIYRQSVSDPLAIMYEADSDSAFIHMGSRIGGQYLVYTAFHYRSVVQDYEVRTVNPLYPDEWVRNRTNTALIPPENDTLHVVSYNSSDFYGLRIYDIPMEGDGTHIEWQMPGNNAGGNRLYCPRHYLGVTPPKQKDVPQSFQLNPVYPNPFNPSTQIAFDLKKQGVVKLAVYDVLGREVATLLNRSMEAGSHKVSFLADELPSGVYFYKLSSGVNSQVRKMVLMK